MKKDFLILIAIVGVVILVLLAFFGLNNQNKFKQTVWIEKENGEGPWKLKSGSRSREESSQASGKGYDDIVIKKTTSSHRVIFSTSSSEVQEMFFYQDEKIPEVNY